MQHKLQEQGARVKSESDKTEEGVEIISYSNCCSPAHATATHLFCSSKSRLVLTFLVLPFWYLLTRVVPDKFQKSSKTVVCVYVTQIILCDAMAW